MRRTWKPDRQITDRQVEQLDQFYGRPATRVTAPPDNPVVDALVTGWLAGLITDDDLIAALDRQPIPSTEGAF